MYRKVAGCGGAISVDATGEFAAVFTTERMPWAAVDRHGKLRCGFKPGEDIVKDL